jgi:hypothetical protein
VVDGQNKEGNKKEVLVSPLASTMVMNGSLVAVRGLEQDGEQCRPFCQTTQERFKLLVDLVLWVSRKGGVGAWTGSSWLGIGTDGGHL